MSRRPEFTAGGVVLGIAILLALAGCGETSTRTKTVTVVKEAASVPAQAAESPKRRTRPAIRRTHRQQPVALRDSYVWCDSNIRAKASTTTCPFAENTFYGYYMAGETGLPPVS